VEGRRFARPQDALLVLGLLALAGICCAMLRAAPLGARAVIEQDGRVVLARELAQLAGPEEVTVTGAQGVRLTIALYPDGAQVIAAGCPDQVCVRTGKLGRAGESAVCLPARVALRLEGGGGAGEADAVTG